MAAERSRDGGPWMPDHRQVRRSERKKGGGRRSSPAARSLVVRSSAATLRSSRSHSSPPARPCHRRWGTRQHSTGRCTGGTCTCQSRSSRSSHTSDSRRPGSRRQRARRARGPALPREKNCSSENSHTCEESNRSDHGTTRARGESKTQATCCHGCLKLPGRDQGHERLPIQFRHTPKRIRDGRIGTASEAARYSRLTPMTCGVGGVADDTRPGMASSRLVSQPAFVGASG